MLVVATHDGRYTRSKHHPQGSKVARALSRGEAVHLFSDSIDFGFLAWQVWTQGTYVGVIRGWERFVWRSPHAIGQRSQAGQSDIALYYVEIKVSPRGDYHLVPRTKPANDYEVRVA